MIQIDLLFRELTLKEWKYFIHHGRNRTLSLFLFLFFYYHLRVRENSEDQELSKEHESLSFFSLCCYPYCEITKFKAVQSLF